MASLTIGQVARACGVGVETIRFYEREELVPQPPRPEVGFRRYPPETVKRVLFIQRSKALGFSLREIRDLLSLRVDSARSCNQVRKHAEAKVADIEEKIETLRGMRQALEKLVADREIRVIRADGAQLAELEVIEDRGDRPSGKPRDLFETLRFPQFVHQSDVSVSPGHISPSVNSP